MDNMLKNELRKFGLLPLSLDEIAQKGIDTSKFGETHYSPNADPELVKKQMAITANVIILHELEERNQADSRFYLNTVKKIERDLVYIKNNGINGGILMFTGDSKDVGIVRTVCDMPSTNSDMSQYRSFLIR